MKTAGVKMDLESDTAQIFDKDIALNLTTSAVRTTRPEKSDIFSQRYQSQPITKISKTLLILS